MYQFDPPRTFSACKAGKLGDATGTRSPGLGRVIPKLDVNWGRSWGHQLKRVLANSDVWGAMDSADNVVDK